MKNNEVTPADIEAAKKIREKLWAWGYKIGYDAQGLREDLVRQIDNEFAQIIAANARPDPCAGGYN